MSGITVLLFLFLLENVKGHRGGVAGDIDCANSTLVDFYTTPECYPSEGVNEHQYMQNPDDKFSKNYPEYGDYFTFFGSIKCISTRSETPTNNKLTILNDVEDLLDFIRPAEPLYEFHYIAKCVWIIFYSKYSRECSAVAADINTLPKKFPTLEFGVMDISVCRELNAALKIYGVPAMYLFHGGQVVSKFPGNVSSYLERIKNFTGIHPVEYTPTEIDFLEPLSIVPVETFDMNLLLAWGCIIGIAIIYLVKYNILFRA